MRLLLFVALSLTAHAAPALQRKIPQPLAGHPGHVFVRGEVVTLARPDAAGATGWACVDYDGKIIVSGAETTAKLGALPVGYYELWATSDGGKRLAKTTLAVLEPLQAPTPQNSPIGLDMASAWFYNPRDRQPARVREASSLAALAGVNYVRDRLTWSAMEPERGQFAPPNFYDETARVQNEAGLQVLQVFHSSPKWANPNGERFPLDLRDAYNFTRAMAARWHGQVRAWEPWNEADIPGFGGHSGLEIATYQKAAYWGLRAGDPSVTVCQNVFAQPSRTGVLENFLENETAAYFDTFNFHHYIAPDAFAPAYEVMRGASSGKPIWVSEAGTHTPFEGASKEVSVENQQRQARFVTQCYAVSIHEGASEIFYFLLPYYEENSTLFGLNYRDLTPRPGYLSLAAAGRFLAGAKPLGRVKSATSLRAFAFKALPDGKPRTVIVAWSQEGKVALPLASAKVLQAFDFLGRPLAVPATLEGGTDPIYLIFPPGAERQWPLTAPPSLPPRATNKPCPVVLQAAIPPERVRLSDSACRLAHGETYEVPFFVYNFGAQAITTRLKIAAPASLKVEAPTEPFTLQPMERHAITVRVGEGQGPMPLGVIPVRFSADCGTRGQALAVLRFMLPIEEIEPAKSLTLKSATNLANWRKNQSAGQMNLEIADGGVLVDSTLQPGDRWVYPVLTPLAAERPLGDWDGVAFTIVPLAGQGQYRTMFDEENGATYLEDVDFPKTLEMGKPYRAVILFKRSNWGVFSKADPGGKLDLDQIRSLRIGLNTQDDHVRFIVRDVAWVKYASAIR